MTQDTTQPEQQTGEAHPLSTDLGSVAVGFPLLAAGQLLEWKVDKSELLTPEDQTKAPAWKLQVSCLSPSTAQTGEQLPVGAKVFLRCQLAPTGKATMELVQQGVAGIGQMIGLFYKGCPYTMQNYAEWIPLAAGKTFRAKTKIRTDKTGQYDPTNELVSVK